MTTEQEVGPQIKSILDLPHASVFQRGDADIQLTLQRMYPEKSKAETAFAAARAAFLRVSQDASPMPTSKSYEY
jgi:hypothetical protein